MTITDKEKLEWIGRIVNDIKLKLPKSVDYHVKQQLDQIKDVLKKRSLTDEQGYQEAKNFASTVCPIGVNAEFVEDSWQPIDKYGRSVGLVYCNDMMLNELLLTNGHAEISTYYCDKSEFGSEDWARAYGC